MYETWNQLYEKENIWVDDFHVKYRSVAHFVFFFVNMLWHILIENPHPYYFFRTLSTLKVVNNKISSLSKDANFASIRMIQILVFCGKICNFQLQYISSMFILLREKLTFGQKIYISLPFLCTQEILIKIILHPSTIHN